MAIVFSSFNDFLETMKSRKKKSIQKERNFLKEIFKKNKRNEENNRIIELFLKFSDINLISITPTNYNLNKKSVFGYLNQ